jgi:hypothetical protein
MEMNDNHIEYHTCSEFLEFCVNGPDSKKAGARSLPHLRHVVLSAT